MVEILYYLYILEPIMMENNNKNSGFPERLKRLRMEKGFSQTEIAEKLGVNSNNIGRYERGESNPNAKFLKALADCLDVSVDYLYDGIEENAAIADLKDKELLEMFAKVEKLSEKDKKLVKEFLGAFVKNREAASVLAS